MQAKDEQEWEFYTAGLRRIKVDGGHIYESFDAMTNIALVFVPDIDLKRYEAHLRDAYRNGYNSGWSDAKNGDDEQFKRIEVQGC